MGSPDDRVFAMGLRTGNWGPLAYLLPFHADVDVQLAPADSPDVVVRILRGLVAVDRDLHAQDLVEVKVCDPTGDPRLVVRPRAGTADRYDDAPVSGVWELRIEATDNRQLHLYAREGTPFPSEADLDALARSAETAPDSV